MELIALRQAGLKPGAKKRGARAPLPVDGAASRRRAAQLAVNALVRALRSIAERQVLQR